MQFSETLSAFRNSLTQPHDIIWLFSLRAGEVQLSSLFCHTCKDAEDAHIKSYLLAWEVNWFFLRGDTPEWICILHRLWKVSRRCAEQARPWKKRGVLLWRESSSLTVNLTDVPPSTRIKRCGTAQIAHLQSGVSHKSPWAPYKSSLARTN